MDVMVWFSRQTKLFELMNEKREGSNAESRTTVKTRSTEVKVCLSFRMNFMCFVR